MFELLGHEAYWEMRPRTLVLTIWRDSLVIPVNMLLCTDPDFRNPSRLTTVTNPNVLWCIKIMVSIVGTYPFSTGAATSPNPEQPLVLIGLTFTNAGEGRMEQINRL